VQRRDGDGGAQTLAMGGVASERDRTSEPQAMGKKQHDSRGVYSSPRGLTGLGWKRHGLILTHHLSKRCRGSERGAASPAFLHPQIRRVGSAHPKEPYRSCSAGHVSAGFGLFQLILSHRTLLNQPKSAEILPAEHSWND
jgi:hypothetical protein